MAAPRPTAVTVFGVLNILFAILGVVGIISTIAMLGMTDTSNPLVRAMFENPGYRAWLQWTIPLGVLSCLVLLFAGVGLLRLKGWGRMLSLIYAVYAILIGLVALVVNYQFMLRPMLEQAQDQQGPAAIANIAGAVGGTLGGCVGLIYPVLILIFLTRRRIVAAFHPTPSTEPAPPG